MGRAGTPEFRWLHLTPSVSVTDPFSREVLVSTLATSTDASSNMDDEARRAWL